MPATRMVIAGAIARGDDGRGLAFPLFDLNVSDARTPHLAFEVRQKEISLEPKALVASMQAVTPYPCPPPE